MIKVSVRNWFRVTVSLKVLIRIRVRLSFRIGFKLLV